MKVFPFKLLLKPIKWQSFHVDRQVKSSGAKQKNKQDARCIATKWVNKAELAYNLFACFGKQQQEKRTENLKYFLTSQNPKLSAYS